MFCEAMTFAVVQNGLLIQISLKPNLAEDPPNHQQLSILSLSPKNERNDIDWLQFLKAQGHDELVNEHFIYPVHTLLPLQGHNFNRAISDVFPTSWTEHTIVAEIKTGDPMMATKYGQS